MNAAPLIGGSLVVRHPSQAIFELARMTDGRSVATFGVKP